MLYYSLLFRINEKDVSDPFKLINLLFPSVMYILILLIFFLLVGLYVSSRFDGKRVTRAKHTG